MKPFFKAVLLTGLFVGVTDIIAAHVSTWIQSGNFPTKVLQYIAGGALGLETSMKGGVGVALLGLAFHFFIATWWTLVFFVALPKLRFLQFNKYIVGFFYGYVVGACMSFIVLPLSALPDSPFVISRALLGWSILGAVLGIPIAISAYRYYNIKPNAQAITG
ncbi:MAG TPA: hypothetical protein VF141_21995 [Chryseolinea sp.]